MPVFSHRGQPVGDRDRLVAVLEAELKQDPSATGEPQIYEEEITQTQTLHVLVIWDRWQGVPAAARSSIIFDAYERVDPARMLRLKFAFGFTFEEAITGGYLPYKIQDTIRPTDPVDRQAVRAEMIGLGARETASGLELRFPYRSLADQALGTLESKFGIGKGYFSLVQEVGSVGKWARA